MFICLPRLECIKIDNGVVQYANIPNIQRKAVVEACHQLRLCMLAPVGCGLSPLLGLLRPTINRALFSLICKIFGVKYTLKTGLFIHQQLCCLQILHSRGGFVDAKRLGVYRCTNEYHDA